MRVTGARAVGPGRVLFAVLRIGKQRHVEYHVGAISVEIDGATVDVSVDTETRYGPLEQLSGTWERVSKHPAARLFDARAPAPHERVELKAFVVSPDDTLALRATALERELEGGGPRTIAQARLRQVRAHHLARGANALDRLVSDGDAPAPRARRRRWLPWRPDLPSGVSRSLGVPRLIELTTLAAGAALAGAALLAHARPLAADLGIIAATAIALTLAIRRARVMPLAFHAASGEPLGKGIPWSGMVSFMFVMTLGLMSMPIFTDLHGEPIDGKPPCATPVIACLDAVMWAIALVSLTVQEWRASRLAAAILAAPRHAVPPREGQWGFVEGTVARSGTKPVLASIFEEEYREGSTPNATVYRGSVTPFAVETDEDHSVQVRTDGILWGAANRIEHGFRVATANERRVTVAERTLEPGASVVVAGRLRDGALVSTSPESLLAFGAARSPRAALAWALWSGRGLRLVLALGLLALVVTTIWHPGLPPANLPAGD